MPDIPENLQNRMNHLRAQELVAADIARENAEHAELLRQQDVEANIEALRLGRQYVNLLEEVGAPSVKIYDNFPRLKEQWLTKLGVSYSFADGRKKLPSDEEIDEMIRPTGEGWVVGFGIEYFSLEGGSNDWAYAIDNEGQILSSFKEAVSAKDLLGGKERGIGKGIFHPTRQYGRSALASANDKKFLDGLAWILEGNEPGRREY